MVKENVDQAAMEMYQYVVTLSEVVPLLTGLQPRADLMPRPQERRSRIRICRP
jgi:hypothetical protein